MRLVALSLTCAALILCGVPAAGQAPANALNKTSPGTDGPLVDVNKIDPETFHAMAVRLPNGIVPKIDGHLDEKAWRLTQPVGDFIQREPRFGAPSTEPTEVRFLYDDKKLYVGVWAYDSDPQGIQASEMKRDSGLRKGDQVKLTIDTFHDHRNAFYFSTNPLGARKDAQSVENGRTVNYDWNAVWECKTSIDGHGWYVEIAIPFSQLRFKGGPGETTWGLNLCRIIIRKNEETYWVPFPREWSSVGFARMSHAGSLLGLRDLRPRRRLEFLPFVAPQVSRNYQAGTPTEAEAKYGFDLRMGVTSNLTADLTYKTDFAQVEADQEVVNLTRFSLYFPEKRQFFTESAGVFDFGGTGTNLLGSAAEGGGGTGTGLLPLFYSRRIGLHEGLEVPIVGGGKLTGKIGPYTLGVMNIETDRVRYASESDQPEATDIPRANYSVFRMKRDVLANSTMGVIFLNRQGGSGSGFNRTLGFDTGFVVGPHLKLTGLLARTFSPQTKGKDAAGAVDFNWTSDRFNSGFTYLDVGERFNAEMGFITRTDIRKTKAEASWTPRPKWKGVRQLTFKGAVDYFENHQGRVESRNQALDFTLQRQDSSSLQFNFDRDYDFLPEDWEIGAGTIPTGEYQWNTYRASYSSDQSRRVYWNGSIDWGTYYSGRKQTLAAGVNFLPLETLLVETSYTRNRFVLPAFETHHTNTLSTRVSYSFSPDLFVKSFIQYNDDRHLASFNFLFWYIYRPGSDLYVVYNQGWETNLPELRSYQVRDRSITVKMTYWWSR